MKKLIALAIVAIASQVVSASAGEAVASSKEVAAPPPALPTSYFRSNEFSLGLQCIGFGIDGDFFNEVPGDFFGSTVTGNVILRYPLDIKFPGLHLAPYAFGGVGGLFNENNGFTRVATFGNQHRLNRRNTDNELLGDGGVGLEYRFTPHIGLFSDVRYNIVDGPDNNFLLTRVGVRFAF